MILTGNYLLFNNRKTIDEEGFEEIKVKFYRLMVEYYAHEVDSWEVCQCFFKVSDYILFCTMMKMMTFGIYNAACVWCAPSLDLRHSDHEAGRSQLEGRSDGLHCIPHYLKV
jgi:hypothetical protein